MDIKFMQSIPYKNRAQNKPRLTPRKGHREFRYQQYSIAGKLIKTWDSLLEIETVGVPATCGRFRNQLISNCCNGDRDTHGGYKWKKIPYKA